MDYAKFLRDVAEAGRFKHDQNLHDRKIIVQVGTEEVEIELLEIDGLGNICIVIDGSWI
ncbi:hypothetical protein ACFSR7_35870 [Cohnella sp. GCM10020058]|uniref:hypothetical protein n=1 Tax=Cohnella sp. GCM10020058 TaxID=3317330 RepID=UPI00362DD7E4